MTRTATRTVTRARARTRAGNRIRGLLTTRGRAFVAAGLTLLAGGTLLGFADISRVGVLLCALPLLAGHSARRNSNEIAVTRTVHPARLVVNQIVNIAIVLENASGSRTRLQLGEERIHYLLGDRPRFVLPAMEPGDIREVDYQIRAQARGRYRLGPLTLRRQDPYGLASVNDSVGGTTEVLVVPRIETLGRGRVHGTGIGTEGVNPAMIALRGEDDVAVRSYREGDDLRRIHWPTTAHRSELMMRQEDHPARRRAVIVLDSRTAGHRGSGTTGSFEWAVTAAASIAAHLSAHRYVLHLASSETAADGQAMQALTVDDALTHLAMAQLGESHQLDEVLRWAHPLTATGGLVIAIVTDHDEAMLRQTAALRQPEGTGLLILIDTASFARPQPGLPTERTRALADLVTATGWSTCVVSRGMTVAQAWDIISAHSAVMAGDGR